MPTRIEIIPGSGGNPPTVDQEKVGVSKGKQDRVEWWSRSHDWAVVFGDPKPFEDYYYSPCHPGNTQVTGDYGEYKYTIFVDGNSADPIIIVEE